MIKVILGSLNKSKKSAIEKAFNDLEILEYEIVSVSVDSKVSSKPIGEETLNGALNRNAELFEYCKSNNIDYDILISMEGGYEQVGNYYFLITYASIYDKKLEKEAIGKSQGLPITPKMFEWVKSGNSFNKVIENMIHEKENKKGNGLSGYLTNGYYYRSYFDSSAITSALEYLINLETYQNLEKNYKKQRLNIILYILKNVYYIHHGAKIRYIDPLFNNERISKCCKIAKKMIDNNLSYDMNNYVYLDFKLD